MGAVLLGKWGNGLPLGYYMCCIRSFSRSLVEEVADTKTWVVKNSVYAISSFEVSSLRVAIWARWGH